MVIFYGLADFGHQPLIKSYIVDRNEDGAEHFANVEKVPDGAACEIGAAIAVAAGLDWVGGIGVSGVSQVSGACFCESKGVSAIPRGQDTIEHIDACTNGNDDVGGCADAHQVSGFVGWQKPGGACGYVEEVVIAFADAEAANGVAVKIEFDKFRCALLAQGWVYAALNDAE